MKEKKAPVIKNSKQGWTKVTFYPDFAKFGMVGFEQGIVDLLTKRVYDMAGCMHSSVKVYLNGSQIKIKNFKEYVDLYLPEGGDSPKVYERVNDRYVLVTQPWLATAFLTSS